MIVKVRKAERSCHAVSFKTSKDNGSLVAVEVLGLIGCSGKAASDCSTGKDFWR